MNWLANLHRSHVRVVAVVVLVLTGAALAGLPRLAFDDDPRSMVREQRTEFDQLEAFYTDFGPDDQDVLLLIEGDLFSLPAQTALRNTMRALRSLPEVESVVGLLDVRRRGLIPIPLIPTSNLTPERLADARAAALRNPVACGQFLSADAQTTVINVRLTGRKLPVYQLEPAVKLLRSTAAEHLNPAGLALRLAGHPPMRIDLLLTLRFEVIKFAMLGMLISGGIALVVFRSPSAILLTSLGPAAGVIWTLGGMGWVGVKIDPLTVVLPTLMFVIGFTDSVHLVTDMRCSRAKGLSARESAAAAVTHLGPACLLTALTTAAGFGSLIVARADSIQRFGITCTVGTLILFAAVQLVVPLLAALFLGSITTSTSPLAGLDSSVAWLEPTYLWLLRRPRRVATIGLLVTLVCFVTSLQLRSDLRWTESLNDASETVQVTRRCDEAFGGALFAYVVVEWPVGNDLRSESTFQTLRDVHTACDKAKSLHGPFSVLTILETLKRPRDTLSDQVQYLERMPPELLQRFVLPESRKVAVSLHVPDIGAARLSPEFAQLEGRLRQIERDHPGFQIHLTGTVVVAARNVHQMIDDLAWSMTLAGVVIFLMTAALFRSLFLGLLSVIPNVFPQAITASLLVLTDRPLSMTSVLTFSLCLGLSVDDTVHFLMRFREEQMRGGSLTEVIFRTFRAVGGVMITTSLVLIGGFLAMLASEMPGIRVFASLSSITLVSAIAGDLIMLPSLLLCFSDRQTSIPTGAAASVAQADVVRRK